MPPRRSRLKACLLYPTLPCLSIAFFKKVTQLCRGFAERFPFVLREDRSRRDVVRQSHAAAFGQRGGKPVGVDAGRQKTGVFRRQTDAFRAVFRPAGKDRAAAKQNAARAQDVLVFARAGKAGGSVVLAVNLNSEPIAALRLRAPQAKAAAVLAPDGAWRTLDFKRDGEFVVLPVPLAFYEAKVVKVE